MASCFSCFSATFHYHFDNFTFARSRESVHNHHNTYPRLQSLRPTSFISLASHKARQNRKNRKGASCSPSKDRQKASPQRSSLTSSRRSPSGSQRISSAKPEETQTIQEPLGQQLRHSRPYRDPTRHVSFARVPSRPRSSELDLLPLGRILRSIPYSTCPLYFPNPPQVKVMMRLLLTHLRRGRLHLGVMQVILPKKPLRATKVG